MTDEHQALLAELEQARERATSLLQAKIQAVVDQIEDAAARAVADLNVVLPPDPETLLPLTETADRLEALTPPPPPEPEPAVGLEALRRLDAGRAQSEVLQELLRQVEPFGGARGILVFRDGRYAGWAGAGFDGDDPVREWRGEIGGFEALEKVSQGSVVVTGTGAGEALGQWFGSADHRVLLVPMSLRGKVVGALVVASAGELLAAEMIQLLTYVAGLQLETLTVRPHVPTPALAEAETIGDAAEVAEDDSVFAPAEELEPPAEVPAEDAAVAVDAAEPDEVQASWQEEAPAEEAVEEYRAEAVAEPEPEAEAEAEVEPETEVEVEAVEEPAVEEPAVEEAVEDLGEDIGVAVAEPEPAGSATVHIPEVPVVAAAGALSGEDERKHEEARRFARLLVSEIRLYNEQAVQEGKSNRDIYQRLREDIDRSREMYEQRVPAEVRAASNYFFEELVRILADGDPDALGL